METWQEKYLDSSLDKLLSATTSTLMLLARLQATGIICATDVEEIKSKPTDTEKSYRLYHILRSRTNSYCALTKALYEEKQSGAVKILLNGFLEHGISAPLKKCNIQISIEQIMSLNVKFMSRTCMLKEVFTNFPICEMKNLIDTGNFDKDLIDIFYNESKELVLVENTLPSEPLVYIPRRISNRVQLNSQIFRHACSDIFVFKNIRRVQLTRLVEPNETSTSSQQLLSLSVRFICLNNDVDWDKLKEKSSSPIHLVAYESQPETYIIEESVGNSKILSRFILRKSTDNRLNISEEDLVNKCLSEKKSSGICICDTPGMGKTYLLGKIARSLNVTINSSSFCIVAYFVSSQWSAIIKNSDNLANFTALCCVKTVLEQIAPTKLAQAILLKALASGVVVLHLFVDGFDEMPLEHAKPAMELFKKLVQNKNMVKLYVTSRPHFRAEIQQALGTISYDILPFSKQNQLDFLVKFWESKFEEYDSTKLNEFATRSLDELTKNLDKTERELLGIPMQCYLIGVANQENAEIYSHPERHNIYITTVLSTAKSLCDMYKGFMKDRFKVKESLRSEDKNQTKIDIIAVKQFHVLQAIKLLFPSIADAFVETEHPITVLSPPQYLSLGILEAISKDGKLKLQFVHRTLAEFLVSEYFAELITGYRCVNSDSNAQAKQLIEFFFETVLSYNPTEKCLVLLNWNHPQRETKLNYTPHFYQFSNTLVAIFVNGMLQQSNEIKALSDYCIPTHLLPQIDPRKHYFLINCCIFSKHLYSLRYIKCIFKSVPSNNLEQYKVYLLRNKFPVDIVQEKDNYMNMLCLLFCVAYAKSTLDIAKEVLDLASNCFQYNVLNALDSLPSCIKHPITWAIERADYNMVEFVLKGVSIQNRQLLYYCMEDSYGESQQKIQERLDVCDLLVSENRNVLYEPAYSAKYDGVETLCSGPILTYSMHFEMIKFLMEEDADISATFEGKSILLRASEWMSANDYNEFILYMLNDRKGCQLFQQKPESSDLLFELCQNKKLFAETLEKIISTVDVNVKGKSLEGNNLVISALVGGKSVALIKKLIELGAEYNVTNSLGMNVIQIAAETGNLEALKYFHSLGMSLSNNVKPPLLLAKDHLHIVKYLLTNGVESKTFDEEGNSIVHLAAKHMECEHDFHNLVEFLLISCKEEGLFNIENKNNECVLDIRCARYDVLKGILVEKMFYCKANILPETLELLLKLPNTNVNKILRNGKNLFLNAIIVGQSLPILKLLVKYGADYKFSDKDNQNALHLLMIKVRKDLDDLHQITEYLISIGVDVNQRTKRAGNSVLYHAVAYRVDVSTIKILLRNGADINVTSDGNILHVAVEHHHIEALKYFLEYGVDPNVSNNRGKTLKDLIAANFEVWNEDVESLQFWNLCDVKTKESDTFINLFE